MTIKRESDGTWTWKGSKEGAQEFDELATAEALKRQHHRVHRVDGLAAGEADEDVPHGG